MRKFRWILVFPLLLVALVIFSNVCLAADSLDSVVDVQKYNRAIHIMAMLLVGFWPSFCAALVPVAKVPQTAVNVVIALLRRNISYLRFLEKEWMLKNLSMLR